MRNYLPISSIQLAACFCSLICFALEHPAVAKTAGVLKGTVQQDNAINPSLTIINSQTAPAAPRQIPTTGLKKNDTTAPNGKTPINGNVNANDPKNKAAATPPPPPVPRTWYAPGHEVLLHILPKPLNPASDKANQTKAKVAPNPPSTPTTPTTSTTVPPAPSLKGVTSWRPGYEIKKIAPVTPANANGKNVANNGASNGANTRTPRQVAAVNGPQIPIMKATPLLLPELKSKSDEKASSWEGWYKHVANAVYARWEYVEVGPGAATVEVTLTPNQDVSCRLVDFTPAQGVERNIVAETKFREAAIRAVNNVRSYEIGNPPSADYKKVVFDVELSRTVNGPIGVYIESVNSPSAKDESSKGPIKVETKVEAKVQGKAKGK
jgi:hypothetical protein